MFFILSLHRTTWVKVHGTRYSKGCIMIVGMEYGTPLFGEVNRVYIIDGRSFTFQYKKLLTSEYVQHLNAYRVVYANDMGYVKQAELQDFHPLGIHKGYGCYSAQLYIVLRYRVDYD